MEGVVVEPRNNRFQVGPDFTERRDLRAVFAPSRGSGCDDAQFLLIFIKRAVILQE